MNSKEKGGREDEGAVKENQTLNLNMPDHSSTSCSGRGKNENTFNQIPIVVTPQKRKLWRDSNVAKLVGIFSQPTNNLPGDYEFQTSESPAKRRRVGGHRGQGQ